MASKTASGLVAITIVILAAAFLAPKLLDTLGSLLEEATGANEPVIVGKGDATIMVAVETRARVAVCTPQVIIAERRCGDLRVLIVDASRIPFIARNTKLAWQSGAQEY